MGRKYSVRCMSCGLKMPLEEEMLGERVTCPSCVETFTVPAFPDPAAGVEPIAEKKRPEPEEPPADDFDHEYDPDAETESDEQDEFEITGQGTWTSIIIGAVALVVLAGILLLVNRGGDSIEVLPEDITVVNRDLKRISDEEIEWEVTVVNNSKGTANLDLELEIYNQSGDVIHRDPMSDITLKPSQLRKLKRTSDYFSGESDRAFSRYEVVPKLR